MAKKALQTNKPRLDEGTLKKGGVNTGYQVTERPPAPPPMKPTANPPKPAAGKKRT